ncbi:MAG: cation-translocating P-type ATPase [Verrucomicrobiota bacterium]|nr:cation-translocating P-type ATPase [Verrucomicrobiota bacterium]
MGTVAGNRAVEVELLVSGMTCSNCARHVTEALRQVPGVTSASVSVEEGKARVQWQSREVASEELLFKALNQAGYEGKLPASAKGSLWDEWSPLQGWRFNVVIGSAVTIPLMFMEWVLGVGMERWYQWLSFGLATPIQLIGGLRFYHGAYRQLSNKQAGMDTLVSLGSTAAYGFSVWGLFAGWHSHLYFMDSAAIITLLSIGHWLEAKASAQAAAALKALLRLAPERAIRLNADGKEEEVAVAQLSPEDLVRLRPGNQIPTDGIVHEGSGSVDESMLTGESLPVEKERGGKLYAGTINQDRQLTMRVTGVGEQTALSQIIQVVQRAQSSRANIQRLGDKISNVFVPIVVLLALASALWWGFAFESANAFSQWLGTIFWNAHTPSSPLAAAIYHFAAVLIIACPCAMGIATPIAIMAGTNAAAKVGILIRDGIALEKSGHISAVLFDKTGTLTMGKITLVSAERVGGGLTTGQVRHLAASLAAASTHPLSRAVAVAQTPPLMPMENVQEIRGSGLMGEALLGGTKSFARLGSLAWLRSLNIKTEGSEAFIAKWSAEAATILGLSLNEELVGLIALKDQIKAHSREVVQQLLNSGKTVYLVTGDSVATAEAVAQAAGIPKENVFAETRPEKKVEVIRALQKKGERVAFVGDGINDAPALTQADLGIAMSNASDAARNASDIILLRADIEGVPDALALAQGTLRVIKQNLFWAFFYNATGVPLAMFGLFSPIMGAVAMGLSDLLLVGNALRLRWFVKPTVKS